MKYSETLKWFNNIWWDERQRIVDCLVDVTITRGGAGYYVVELNEKLKIHNLAEVRRLPCTYRIIGKAVKFDCVL